METIARRSKLEWQTVGGSWFADRYRIDRISARIWRLSLVDPIDSAPVRVENGPVAELPSLQACRHKAQSLHDDGLLDQKRQRLAAVAAVGLSVAVVWSSTPLAAAVAGVVGAAALIDLGLTWVERGLAGSVSDLLQ